MGCDCFEIFINEGLMFCFMLNNSGCVLILWIWMNLMDD